MVVNMLPAAIRAVSDLVGGDKMAGMAEFVAETYDRLVTAVVLKKAHGDARAVLMAGWGSTECM